MFAVTLMCINALLFVCVNLGLVISAYTLGHAKKSLTELVHRISASCFLANGTIALAFYLISFIDISEQCQTVTVCELYDVMFQLQSHRSSYLWFSLFACTVVGFHTVAWTRLQKTTGKMERTGPI